MCQPFCVLERVRLREPRADGASRRTGRPRLRARAGEPRRGARGARAARGEGAVRRLRWLARVLERALAITGALAIVYHLGFEVTWFRTSSMAPCLVGSDRGEPDWALVARLA